jgi:hypothetical protein
VLQEPCLKNLESLVVAGVGQNGTLWQYDAEWHVYDYSHLKQVMLKHLPKLQHFSWTDMWNPESMESIGSFLTFNKLRTLILDVHFFRDKAIDDDDDEGDDDYF